ncbi:MAG: S-layer homology domain-containing protein [Oscillospiraceae bacterium]|jgi:uncharacterized protein YkwD|nr:S-layer homology domain-containing protein [Oscillospiraceae bacterium]
MLQKLSNKLLGLLLAVAVLLSAFVPALRAAADNIPDTPFTDSKKSQWFYGDVAYCYYYGIMQGVSATTFEPSAPVTRAMLVTMLHQLQGKPAVSTDSGFSDVSGDEWFAIPVSWAKKTGIVAGYEDGTFAPNKGITRQELVAVMYRYAQEIEGKDVSAGSASDLSFNDSAQIQTWAVPAVKWAVANNIVKGMDGNVFVPNGGATRAEAAVIFHKYLDPGAKAYVPTLEFGLDLSEAQTESILGAPYRTITDSNGTTLCFYGSYDDFYLVYFRDGVSVYYYSNDIAAVIADNPGFEQYTDSNDGDVIYAVYEGAPGTVSESATEQVIFELTNAFRGFHGKSALIWNDKLALAARNHSIDMATRGFFDHINPDGKTPWDRIAEAGYDAFGSGENIDAGYANGQAAVNGWVNSSGHRDNMLAGHTELGVGWALGGIYGRYGTQCFGIR